MTCTHSRYAACKMPTQNGRFNKTAQCLDCGLRLNLGNKGSVFMPLAPGESWDDLPLFDAGKADKARQIIGDAISAEFAERRRRDWADKHQKYEDYITNSPEWKERRRLVIQRCRGLCEACLRNSVSDVHHVNYDSLHDEVLWDLKGVCRPCHEKIHGMKR